MQALDVLTSSGRMLIGMRLRSSGEARRSHIVLGMTPNIAPPSRRNVPSVSDISSNDPKRILPSF
jgi:hypothetical protein